MRRQVEDTAPDELLTLSEVRGGLASHGVALSDRRLKRLRAEGLLPCEGQYHPAGVRGSLSLYPAWCPDQLALVERVARKERRFLELRILVRWHGGWVERGALGDSLAGLLERVSTKARQLASGPGDEGDQADRLARAMSRSPGRSGPSRLMRTRLGGAGFATERAAYAFSALVTRAEISWDNHDPADSVEPLHVVFDRATGIDRARADEIAGSGPLLGAEESTQEIVGELQRAGCFDLLDLGRAFRDADDSAIDRAFADAHRLAGLAPGLAAIQQVAGEDMAGLGSLTELIDDDPDAWGVAVIVRHCLLLQPLVSEDALETIAHAVEEALPAIDATLQIRRGLPSYAEFLGVDGAARLAALPDTERARITGNIRAFVAADPQLAARVDQIAG